jgi:protein-tyrosine phosphatase
MRSRRVLVVCEGNLARSPFAAALLEREWTARFADPVTVVSAGVRAQPGAPAAPPMRSAAAEQGLSLDGHRARRVTRELVADTDLVLTMTESQREEVQRLLPAATARAFTLAEFVRLLGRLEVGQGPGLADMVAAAHAARPMLSVPDSPEDVADPYGRSEDAYASVVRHLVELCTEMVRRCRAVTGQHRGIAADR